MPKMTYKVTVGTSSTVIAPDLNTNENNVSLWANKAIVQGEFAKVGDFGGTIYWAVNAGIATIEPSHSIGVEDAGDGIEWLAINQARNLVISADPYNPIFLAKDSIATGNEGIYFDGSKARDYGNYMGKVSGIAEAGDAVITVEV